MNYSKVRNIIIFISLICFVISLLLSIGNIVFAIFFPLIFAILLYWILPKNLVLTPGLSVALGVMLIRYVIAIPFFTQSSFKLYFEEFSSDVLKTYILMIVEMIVILFTIRKYCFKDSINKLEIKHIRYNYLIPIIFVAISAFGSILDPIPLSRYHFILEQTDSLTVTDLDGATAGLPRLLQYTHLLLIPTIFAFFYNKMQKRFNTTKLYILIGLTLLICCFYTDQSRNSMLRPLLALLFLFHKYVQQYSKKIILIFAVVGILSMGYLSVLKFFKTTDVAQIELHEGGTYSYLNDYFGGFREVYIGVKHREQLSRKIDGMTIFNETILSLHGLNSYKDLDNRTTAFYNNLGYFTTHIIPTIAQGYAYFGFIFAWLFSFLIFRIILFLDKLYLKTQDIGFSFLFSYGACSIAWVHTGNIMIVSTLLADIIVLYLIFYVSKFLASKIR